jgi:hypothetical protein
VQAVRTAAACPLRPQKWLSWRRTPPTPQVPTAHAGDGRRHRAHVRVTGVTRQTP